MRRHLNEPQLHVYCIAWTSCLSASSLFLLFAASNVAGEVSMLIEALPQANSPVGWPKLEKLLLLVACKSK